MTTQNLSLRITHACIGECDDGSTVTIPVGATVEYLGHVPGGMVRVVCDGRKMVIHPGATEELG